MQLKIALAGNQNSGKTTLFNALTGSNQHVGNFPGVTVERKEGVVRGRKGVTLVDLPGVYSLSPYTAEEIVARDYLIAGKPDGILNIVDATNLERNLYLTLQLMELRIPVVIALNMMDEIAANNYSIDVAGLKASLGVEIVPVSAAKKEGIAELADQMIRVAFANILPKRRDFCSGPVHKTLHAVCSVIEQKAEKEAMPARYATTRILEGDAQVEKQLGLTEPEKHRIEAMIREMERTLKTDREAAMADMRYSFIEKVCRQCFARGKQTKEQARSVAIDRILTGKALALPVFFGVMLLLFWLTFVVVGRPLSGLLAAGVRAFSGVADRWLASSAIAPALHDLIIDGIFAGVGSVMSFLPLILVLFFLMSVLEDTGYMARVAFVMDKLLRRIGLSGRSIVPMLMGFGCSVPAIMATRTLSSERDRKMTVLMVPFLSCSAKLPVYFVIVDIFFSNRKALVMAALYFLGIMIGILYGLCYKSAFKGEPVPFVMELPAYRFPSMRSVLLNMWRRAKDFIARAFTVILLASMLIWILQSYSFEFVRVEDASSSMLASVGRILVPVFRPLGIGDWRLSSSLIVGLSAKEAVISTLTVLSGTSETEALAAFLATVMNPSGALSFLVFVLLYMPCFAATAALRRELGSWAGAAVAMLTQTGIAWLAAFLVYQIAVRF